MIIRHYLTTGMNVIPLKNVTYKTEHIQKGDDIRHIGWKIAGDYAGDKVKQAKHRFEIVFTPEEAREHVAKLELMLKRFEGDNIKQIVENIVEDLPDIAE